jgi:hypothetical protein
MSISGGLKISKKAEKPVDTGEDKIIRHFWTTGNRNPEPLGGSEGDIFHPTTTIEINIQTKTGISGCL